MKLLLIYGLLLTIALGFTGCDTPYSDVFGPDDVDRLIQKPADQAGIICLDNGFNRICAPTIRGDRGLPGKRVYVFIFQVPRQKDKSEPPEIVFRDTETDVDITGAIDDDTLTMSIDTVSRSARQTSQ